MKRGAEIMLVFVCMLIGLSLGVTFRSLGFQFQEMVDSHTSESLDSGTPLLDAGE